MILNPNNQNRLTLKNNSKLFSILSFIIATSISLMILYYAIIIPVIPIQTIENANPKDYSNLNIKISDSIIFIFALVGLILSYQAVRLKTNLKVLNRIAILLNGIWFISYGSIIFNILM